MARNNIILPSATSRRTKDSQIHTTHKGGSNDAAIATPAKVSDKRLYQSASIAITHQANAINKSTRVGVVLEMIWVVNEENGTIHVISADTAIQTTTLRKRLFNDLTYMVLCPLFTAKANDWIGCNIGDINIAQITTGDELINNHIVAITEERTNWNQYKLSA